VTHLFQCIISSDTDSTIYGKYYIQDLYVWRSKTTFSHSGVQSMCKLIRTSRSIFHDQDTFPYFIYVKIKVQGQGHLWWYVNTKYHETLSFELMGIRKDDYAISLSILIK
jgi:hypothetical protein